MKCGFCQRPLASLTTLCDCGLDPNAGSITNGRYQLLGLVGQGGMGMIYRALDQGDNNKLCAIKVSRWCEALQQLRQMEPEAAKLEEQARIEREFKLLQKAASRSLHIVQVFDTFHVDPRLGLYYPMEFLNGLPLASIPEWGQPMPSTQVVELILQLCEGVGVAHGLGVAHRDLNPENIFIVKTPEHERFIKLIDFGIARDLYARKGIYNTGSDLAFGHLQYLSPEQVGYDPVTDEYQRETAAKLDHRADIYSIGAIMFHMLTGHPPFDNNTIEGLATRNWRKPPHLAQAIKDGSLPQQLQELIMSCLQPAPNLRLPDILALSDLLQRFVSSRGGGGEFGSVLGSHMTALGEGDELLTNFTEESWEFPAVENSAWDLPAMDDDSLGSAPEMSAFSEEFDNLFSDESSGFPSNDSFGTLETPPPHPARPTPPPHPARPTPPPHPPRPTPPPPPRPTPPTLEGTPPPPSQSFGSHPFGGGNGTAPPSSIPTEVWNSLDNAPAFIGFDDDESSDNDVDVVVDHNKLDVEHFFDGIEQIHEEHGELLHVQNSPSIYGLPERSPQLESLLSLDSLNAATSSSIPEDVSSNILASELLTAMEEITIEEDVSTSPTPSRTSWKKFSPSSQELPIAPPVVGKPVGQPVEPNLNTQQPNLLPSQPQISAAQTAPKKSKAWLWILITMIVIGAGVGIYLKM